MYHWQKEGEKPLNIFGTHLSPQTPYKKLPLIAASINLLKASITRTKNKAERWSPCLNPHEFLKNPTGEPFINMEKILKWQWIPVQARYLIMNMLHFFNADDLFDLFPRTDILILLAMGIILIDNSSNFVDFWLVDGWLLLYAYRHSAQRADTWWWVPARKCIFFSPVFYKTHTPQDNHFPWKKI